MQLEQYVVDAFAREVFSGNPAAVCVLDRWLPDDAIDLCGHAALYSTARINVPMD